MFKKINSENLLWLINGEEPMPAGKTVHKLLKKEAKEGKTYETGIGLNLDLSIMRASTLKEIETHCFTIHPATTGNKSEI